MTLRICLVASSRFPVAEPFAGGLEAHTASLARALRRRGHEVSLFAAPGSDPSLDVHELPLQPFASSDAARSDVGAPPETWMREHHAYLGLMLDLAREGRRRFDVVHNNSLHHLPVAMSSALEIPVVTTLHTPPVPWLESAMRYADPSAAFVAVSEYTSRSWSHAVSSSVVLNGIDAAAWPAGPGGERAIWSGRLVPEKAPHVAIDAALQAGVPIDLAGPVLDPNYAREHVWPRLGPDVRYLGHLRQSDLATAVGRARVAIVTPEWDEPYGLVAAEAMSCGTPVAALRRGALPEVVDEVTGRLAEPGSTAALARAIADAAVLDRARVRRRSVERFALDRMVADYEHVYARAIGRPVAA
ncbi:glycosyltransferase [Aeromicrobium massiliense]|uniref:glycosyltransferase n=1 Tax=Aeromicrobium massiliense TaxID=1464554 RepID=UPI0005785C3E|nr:glycosyltransferase [Aeromicrobium massiliense]